MRSCHQSPPPPLSFSLEAAPPLVQVTHRLKSVESPPNRNGGIMGKWCSIDTGIWLKYFTRLGYMILTFKHLDLPELLGYFRTGVGGYFLRRVGGFLLGGKSNLGLVEQIHGCPRDATLSTFSWIHRETHKWKSIELRVWEIIFQTFQFGQ